MNQGAAFLTKLHVGLTKVSDQPAHPHGLIRVFAGHSMGNEGFKAYSGGQRVKTDQIARMRKVISVFAVRTCNFVRNTVPRPICLLFYGPMIIYQRF